MSRFVSCVSATRLARVRACVAPYPRCRAAFRPHDLCACRVETHTHFTCLVPSLTLLDRCGLRYARSRAKKEGHRPSQRRRKDKSLTSGGITKREASSTPPYLPVPGTSSSAPPSSSMPMRLPSGAAALSASVGASGEMYTHGPLDETKAGLRLTPSPSPPMGFVHYAPGAPAHPHHHPHQFYSVPSPLSHTIPLRDEPSPTAGAEQQQDAAAAAAGVNGAAVPAYVASARSPLTTMPPASFERDRGDRERERERERELPPPLALQGRRILAQQG
ncbi:hypothetical protein C0992_001758 [Termitomyces sp. T32_za158]|nr:hypothetical protein C0992_001758 [Termitomyces sp. T32_za158]